MITQIVLYNVNPKNPKAAEMIVAKAKETLGWIPNTTVTVGQAIDSSRAVASSNGKVVKITTWPDETARQAYMRHPLLRKWCEFVLKGWMLEDSQQSDVVTEFIDHILFGQQKRNRVRNPEIPEEEVVWAGEEIILFSHN